jgi:uracil-DNA glycosylase family 4
MAEGLAGIARDVIACERCPRLRRHCAAVAREKRRAYRDQEYWGRPVPGFGDPRARMLVVGLAPAAHGGNRTGRVFTGDSSGDWLYRALHAAGFASQPTAVSRDDGLRLAGAYVTAICRCAPPANRPLPIERERCATYLERELALLRPTLVTVVCLGGIAWDGTLALLGRLGAELPRPRPRFGHGAELTPGGASWPSILGSYHPSRQNTNTRRLTREMLDLVFARASAVIAAATMP